MPEPITIICQKPTPRLEYITGYLTHITGLAFATVRPRGSDHAQAETSTAVIYYGDDPVPGGFSVYSSGFLAETGLREFEPAILKKGELTMLFPAPEGFDIPFDVFSAVFYLLSRYEEYLPFQPDRYKRFEADQSMGFRYDFLGEPIVDQWIGLLKAELARNNPELNWPKQEFRFECTFDVDNPWAFLHKGFLQTTGALCKQTLLLNFRELRLRLEVLQGKRPDPFDTYDDILNMEREFGFQSRFFFLSGGYGAHDTNYALSSMAFKNLLKRLNSGKRIGIHPSFRSNQSLQLLKFEMERFTRFLGRMPETSRQHFLIIRFPETYRRLITLGLYEDFSMGYASSEGFRAGTCRPFRFYDLLKESPTDLSIHPFLVMDVALQQYLRLNPDEAINRIKGIAAKVKAVSGIFTCLWHNESLSETGVWKGWRRVFEEMVRIVKSDE